MTWLQRSLNVAARFLAPRSFTGFRCPALVCRISPSNWDLLPGAPALPGRISHPLEQRVFQDAPWYRCYQDQKATTLGGLAGGSDLILAMLVG